MLGRKSGRGFYEPGTGAGRAGMRASEDLALRVVSCIVNRGLPGPLRRGDRRGHRPGDEAEGRTIRKDRSSGPRESGA